MKPANILKFFVILSKLSIQSDPKIEIFLLIV